MAGRYSRSAALLKTAFRIGARRHRQSDDLDVTAARCGNRRQILGRVILRNSCSPAGCGKEAGRDK
jgi:hypothetical protein